MYLDLAQIGFTTAILESVVASIGAGMLLGGFAMAVAGLFRGRTRREIEAEALRDACLGGLGAVALLLVDLLTGCVV